MTLSPRSIAVFRALQLGDLLVSVPSLRALRLAFPGAEITLVGLPWARSFAARFSHLVDRFLEFPGYPGLPEIPPRIGRIPAFFAEAQARRFDLAVQLHGSGSFVNSIAVLLGARRTAGFFVPGEYCPDLELFLPYPAGEPEVRQGLRLMEFLGVPSRGDRLEFPLTAADRRDLESLEDARALDGSDYVCIHPGARMLSRRWLPERFAAVGDALAAEGLRVALTGSEEERPLTREVARRMGAPAADLCGGTTLGALGVLISRARLLVCNDTGVSHVAAGLGTPSVVAVLGSDPGRWAPLDVRLHRTVCRPIDCRPCMHHECPIGHPCASAVTVEEILAEARSLLRHARPSLATPPEAPRPQGATT